MLKAAKLCVNSVHKCPDSRGSPESKYEIARCKASLAVFKNQKGSRCQVYCRVLSHSGKLLALPDKTVALRRATPAGKEGLASG